ncbi:MAG: outer membrane protein assembly factor BamA [Flavobacteriaceae bacterium]|jgi:outer membrane protein insertion porin family|nr:outer membrane protein assembly factor BamA [Flavobacteriales bacterium]MDG1272000.1 outer membrane protein assembly factor BamA [Flavobacteriaceae bacterium]
MHKLFFRTFFVTALLFLSGSSSLLAQTSTFEKGKRYMIDSIEVVGLKTYNAKTVISYSGLQKGQTIQVPGEDISKVINKLWKLEFFSDINFYVTRVDGDKIDLQLEIKELPTLSDVKIEGLRKSKAETIIKETELTSGKKLSESFLTNTKNYIVNKYKKNGYLNTKVTLNTIPDDTVPGTNNLKMVVKVDRGSPVKIKDIDFEGNEVFGAAKLRMKLKKTKKRFPLRFWKKSKFIAKEYEEDKKNLIDFYKEKGYRDARIITDSIISIEDKSMAIQLKIQEGNRYYFGDISYLGNSAYTNDQLNRVLGIAPGDPYNGVLLKERIQDEKPDANDLSNLYQNNGYLFSNINAVEVSAENDTIDMEIRVNEGKLARFNKISVIGNDKTNDHVIFREIRTKPGELYSKDKVVRTVRELGQLGFFDAEQISPNFKNVDPNNGTVDIELGLVESGASQIELQGGYGGGGFIGTLGLSFNNFSMQNLWNKKAYKPLPMGDGQSLALRLQASQFYSTYSFSFSEPWLGGRQPVQFSTSLSHTNQYRYDYFTRRADKSQSFEISGISIGLARRLKVPDDFFTLSQSLAYQYYNLNNYYTGLFTFGDGEASNLTYTIALSRNNTYTNPIFPTGGSTFSISAKFTPPYSLFNDIDYADLKNQAKYQDLQGNVLQDKIDQERFRWLEYYKLKFNGTWYTQLIGKLVLKTQTDFGFIGAYNQDRGFIPFERFYLGGDGMANFAMDGRENIALRGYENQSLSSRDGSIIYNKFSLELRYPVTLKPSASIYALTFLESGNGYDSFRAFNPFESKRSAGAGVRIFMPAFGLLGIDFGYGFDNVDPNSSSPNGWETHFIIGQNF